MGDRRRFYEASASGARRSAPAALRNREPIAEVLREWLPSRGAVLEIASGTGEHVTYFAEHFPKLDWQPSDVHPDALASIAAWRELTDLANVRPPLVIDASAPDWPIGKAAMAKIGNGSRDALSPTDWDAGFSAVLCLNMVHISPWAAALGLLAGSARVLVPGGALILYGPWLQSGVSAAPSNLAFDRDLKARDPDWGLRLVEDFDAAALKRGFVLEATRTMPANNLALLFRLQP
ncbi:MAG TPA: DUF938 domain-containing protein [Sphingomicrobium sp.]|nr:DUF938 domain-containing protein [Sphingomicrobium sp.]